MLDLAMNPLSVRASSYQTGVEMIVLDKVATTFVMTVDNLRTFVFHRVHLLCGKT